MPCSSVAVLPGLPGYAAGLIDEFLKKIGLRNEVYCAYDRLYTSFRQMGLECLSSGS